MELLHEWWYERPEDPSLGEVEKHANPPEDEKGYTVCYHFKLNLHYFTILDKSRENTDCLLKAYLKPLSLYKRPERDLIYGIKSGLPYSLID
jgi:hypothetical protein